MRNTLFSRSWRLGVFLLMVIGLQAAVAQSDKEGCSDHLLFPSRIPGYFIGNCEENEFSTHVVLTSNGEKEVQGKKTVLEYFLKEGSKGVSETFVRKNYMDAFRKLGARIETDANGRGVGVLKQADGSTVWVDVSGYVGDGTVEQTGHYYLIILEEGSMEQVITAQSLGDDLKRTGRSVLYLTFDTGKSTLRPESGKIITQMAEYLKANPSVRVSIVGHTDNEGNEESNMKLSQDRAQAVVNALVSQHGVQASQLQARGVGPLSPIATNATDAGRRLNRRVEMVLR
jgi:outer membrane protein OmpA-like peptidoglycan-associated protein